MKKNTMRLILALIALRSLPVFAVNEEVLKFAVVPKFHNAFFDRSGEGCQFAASQLPGVECIYIGPSKGDVRIQDRIILQLLEGGVDGIAVAITESSVLARSSFQKARQLGIPIITYDSDFDILTQRQYQALRFAYVGTDNVEFGRALGKRLQELRPNGGRLLIQTGRPDSPNLNLRIMGLRATLSGKNYQNPPGEILQGENNWTEIRQPIPNFDNSIRAVKQLESMLRAAPAKSDAFVAVGGWPQDDQQLYREMIEPFKGKLKEKQTVLVFADASPAQLSILGDNLAHGNIGQKPYEMGRLAINTLYKIVTNKTYDKMINTPTIYCTPENYKRCTTLKSAHK